MESETIKMLSETPKNETEKSKTKNILLCRAIDFGEDCPQKTAPGIDICTTHKNRKDKGKEIELSDIIREVEIQTCKVLLSTDFYCSYQVESEDSDGLCTLHNGFKKEGRPLKFELSERDIERLKRKKSGTTKSCKHEDENKHCMVIARNGYCKNIISEDYNYICTAHVTAAQKGQKLLIDIGQLPEERFQRVKIPCRAIVKETGLNCIAGNIEMNGICALHNHKIADGEVVKLSDTVKSIIEISCKVYRVRDKRFCEYNAEHDGMCTRHLNMYNSGNSSLCFSEHQQIDLSKYRKNKDKPVNSLILSVPAKPISSVVYSNVSKSNTSPPKLIISKPPQLNAPTMNFLSALSPSDLDNTFPKKPPTLKILNPNNLLEESNSNHSVLEPDIQKELKCKVLTKKTNERCSEKVTHEVDELCTKHYNKALAGEKMRLEIPNGMIFPHCKVLTKNDTYCKMFLSEETKEESLCKKHFKLFLEGKKINTAFLTTIDLKREDIYGICNIMIKIDKRCVENANENGICTLHNKAISNGIVHRTLEDVQKSLIPREPHEMCKAIKIKDRENCINPPEKDGLCNFHLGEIARGKIFETREIPLTTKKIKNGNLFIDNFPELVKEWDHNKNIGIDINTIKYGAQVFVDWICPINKHEYSAKMNARTADLSGCLICSQESNTIINQEKLESFRNESYEKDKLEQNKKSTDIGDESENFIVQLLLETNKFKNVEKIGNIGGDSDITVTQFDDSVKQIQVKTLTKDSENIFHTTIKNYPDDMLIVLLNKERTHFGCIFKKETDNVKCLKLTFGYQFSKYKNKLFQSKEDFTEYLVSKIPFSTSINNISKNILDEKESFQRLEVYCKNNNITYVRNSTNGNSIDVFLNGLRCQAKYASLNTSESNNYRIGNVKNCGRILDNGKTRIIKRPYHKDDFDIFIVNLGGTTKEPDKYKNDFMFIPMKDLDELGIMKNDTVDGKVTFQVCPPDYKKAHWSKKYWNNSSCLTISRQQPLKKLILKIVQ
jgi:hypothetical protein